MTSEIDQPVNEPVLPIGATPIAPGEPASSPGDSIVAPEPIAPQVDSNVNNPEPPKTKRGRPSNADKMARLNGVTAPPPRAPKPAPPPLVSIIKIDHERMAKTCANAWFNLPQLFLGTDWAPDEEEVVPIKDAFKDYFVSVNAPEIPPVWGLVLALVTYTGVHIGKPTVKTRLFGMVEWLKSKIPFRR